MNVKTERRIRRPAGRRDFKKDNESFIKRERDGREVASLSDRGELCEPQIQLLQKSLFFGEAVPRNSFNFSITGGK